tara:strand:- start:8535 stop:8717 length:183 start_codon:yes stop_codon:yes gene_type:complete
MNSTEVKTIRKELNLEPSEMARKLGLSLRDYSQLKNANSSIPKRMAQYLTNLKENNDGKK